MNAKNLPANIIADATYRVEVSSDDSVDRAYEVKGQNLSSFRSPATYFVTSVTLVS